MAKTTTPAAPPAPDLAISLNMAPVVEGLVPPAPEQVVVPEPVAEPVPELVAVDTTPEPVTTQTGPRTVRLAPKYGFPIRHFNGGVTFYPGYPAEVPLDAWLENQIACGILAEV